MAYGEGRLGERCIDRLAQRPGVVLAQKYDSFTYFWDVYALSETDPETIDVEPLEIEPYMTGDWRHYCWSLRLTQPLEFVGFAPAMCPCGHPTM